MGSLISGSTSVSSDCQLRPIRTNLKKHRKRLKAFESNIRLISSSTSKAAFEVAHTSILNEFLLTFKTFKCESKQFEAILDFVQSLLYRLTFCDRLYKEYFVKRKLTSTLNSVRLDLIERTDEIYKKVCNPKDYANNQNDVDLLCMKAQQNLTAYETSQTPMLLQAYKQYIQFSLRYIRIREKIFNILLNCTTITQAGPPADTFQLQLGDSSMFDERTRDELKRQIDLEITRLMYEILPSNSHAPIERLTSLTTISQFAQDSNQPPPTYHALFNIPDWSLAADSINP